MAERTVAVRLVARVDAYTAAMAKAAAATGAFSTSSSRSLVQVGTQMQHIGRRATTWLSLPIIAAGALVVKAASDWESSWAGVTKTVDGTAQQMAELESGLRDMAKSLPATHEEIAAVAEAAGALGIAAPDIEQFTRVMIDLGETTNLSADEAATSIAQLMNVMQTAPGDVDNLASTLVHLGNTGASTEGQILDMATRIAGAGELIGLSEDEVLGFAAAMADLGIPAERGGTAIQRAFLLMNKAVDSGGEKLAAFAEVAGMSGEQFATTFRDDAAGAVVAFVQGLGRIEAEGGNASTALDSIGLKGQLAQQVFLSLLGAGDSLNETLGRSATAFQENTALTDEAAKRYATFAARMEMVRNQIVDLFIDLGTMMLPAIEAIVTNVGKMAQAFQDLPAPVQMAVGGFLALVAAAGPMVFIAGSLIKNLKMINSVFSLTSSSALLASTGMLAIGAALAIGTSAYLGFTQKQREADEATRTAVAALDLQFPALVAAAVAAARAGDEIDGLTLSNQLLSAALSESEDDVLSAIAQFNMSSEDLLHIITQYRMGGAHVGEVWRQMALGLGLTNEQAGKVAVTFQSMSFDEVADNAAALAADIGITEEELGFLTAGFFAFDKAQESVDLESITSKFLESRITVNGYKDSLIEAAEALAGAKWQDNPIAVFQALNQLMLESTDAELENAGVTAQVREEVALLADQLDGAGGSAESFGEGLDVMADRAQNVADVELADAVAELLAINDAAQRVADEGLAALVDETLAVNDAAQRVSDEGLAAMVDEMLNVQDRAQHVSDVELANQVDDMLAINDAAQRVSDEGLAAMIDQMLVASGAAEELEGVAGSTIDTLTYAQEAFNAAARASGNFADELDRLTGKMGGVVEGEEAIWRWALEFNGVLAEQDDELGNVNRSLAINTLEGQANRDLLEEQIQNIVSLNGAYIENGLSVEEAANTTKFNTDRLIENAVAAGFAESEVRELLRQYGLTPEMVTTAIVQADMLTAQQRLDDLLAKYDDIPLEKATQIQALLDWGLIAEAERELNELEATRETPVVAVAYTDEARRKIAALMGTRYVNIVANAIGFDFAEGGYIGSPIYGATVGEAGPEVILPLTNQARMRELLALPQVAGPLAAALGNLQAVSGGGGGSSGGGGSVVYNLTLNHNGPGELVPDAIVSALRKWQRQRGPLPVSVR